MAYPNLVTRDGILETALAQIEKEGTVSLNGLARALGIRPPSLYRYFSSRERLLAAASLAGFRKLADHIRSSTRNDPSPETAAWAIRSFARKRPKLYRMMNEADARYEDREEARMVVLEVVTAAFGRPFDEKELVPLRMALACIRAFVHGFAMLELTGQYQTTRELDRAFAVGLDALLDTFEKQAPGRLRSRRKSTVSNAEDMRPLKGPRAGRSR